MPAATSYRRHMGSAPQAYEICVEGILGTQWSDWFAGMHIRDHDNGRTIITGPVTDHAALHGLLERISELGLRLVSVRRLEP